MRHRAIVLMSGGLDSTACLMWALKQYEDVRPVRFQYEGRSTHRESEAAFAVCHFLECKLLEIPIAVHTIDPMLAVERNLSSAFVPARNLIFLSYATALAWSMEAGSIVAGFNEGDRSPDANRKFASSFARTASIGIGQRVRIQTPLAKKPKWAVWETIYNAGGDRGVSIAREHSYTCYHGMGKRNEWGIGCGECEACLRREQGWMDWQIRCGQHETYSMLRGSGFYG